MQAIRILPAVFTASAALLTLENYMIYKAERYAHARTIFAESVAQTRARLVNGAWQAAVDPSIAHHIALNNLNTVAQSLQSYVRAGEVTQIEVIDRDCNLIVRASVQSKPVASGCRANQAAPDHPVLRWQSSSEDVPVMTVSIPQVIGQKPVMFLAHLVLDQGWISAHPELSGMIQRSDFSLNESSSRGLLWEEGPALNGDSVLRFYVGGWARRFLPNLKLYGLEVSRDAWWLALLLLGSNILVACMQHLIGTRRDDQLRVGLLEWLRTHTDWNKDLATQSYSPEVHHSWEPLLEMIRIRLDRLFDQKQIQTKMMRERYDQLTLAAVERERQMARLQEQLAAMADLASLKEQLQHSTSSFLKKMQDVRELCEDVFDICSEGLVKQGRDLSDLVLRWKTGMKDSHHPERGARKFLRSLSETPGKQPGSSKLDDDLAELSLLTSATRDQALHMAMLSRQALSELESGVQVAALWLGLSMRENERERTSDWTECLLAAQKLVGAETKYSMLTFERLPQLSSPDEMYPPVARIALVSGLFHLYMALLADVDIAAVHLPIVLRQKRLSGQGTMVFSLPQPAHEIADGAPGRGQSYHMELAKAILAPLGIRTAFLPPTIAGVPVALTWVLPNSQVDVSSSASLEN